MTLKLKKVILKSGSVDPRNGMKETSSVVIMARHGCAPQKAAPTRGRREHVAAAGLAFRDDVVIGWFACVRASLSRLQTVAFTGLQKQIVPPHIGQPSLSSRTHVRCPSLFVCESAEIVNAFRFRC